MRVETVEYQGRNFHGFLFGQNKLAVARLVDGKVKIVAGAEARLAIDVMESTPDHAELDNVMGLLSGEFVSPASARAALSPGATALALA